MSVLTQLLYKQESLYLSLFVSFFSNSACSSLSHSQFALVTDSPGTRQLNLKWTLFAALRVVMHFAIMHFSLSRREPRRRHVTSVCLIVCQTAKPWGRTHKTLVEIWVFFSKFGNCIPAFIQLSWCLAFNYCIMQSICFPACFDPYVLYYKLSHYVT